MTILLLEGTSRHADLIDQ